MPTDAPQYKPTAATYVQELRSARELTRIALQADPHSPELLDLLADLESRMVAAVAAKRRERLELAP